MKNRPACNPFGRLGSTVGTIIEHPVPRPARRRGGDAKHLGVWGKAPAGVQRAEPAGARRRGGLSGEERESRGQSPLVRAAEAAPPARSGSPEGRARWLVIAAELHFFPFVLRYQDLARL